MTVMLSYRTSYEAVDFGSQPEIYKRNLHGEVSIIVAMLMNISLYCSTIATVFAVLRIPNMYTMNLV